MQTTGASNVLSAPGGSLTGTQLPGGTGAISGGPSSFSGTTYWSVTFDTAPSGWVAAASLTSLPTLNILPNRWINVQPSYTGAPNGGQIYPQGWGNKQAYDPITHRILVSDRWYDPIRGVSIFANGIHAYDPFSNVFTVLKLNNWFVQTVTCSNGMTGCYQTTPLPANTADPTPPDAHPLGGYDFVPELNALYSVNGVNSVSLPDPSILNRTWKLDLATRTWTVVSSDTTAAVHPPNNGGSPSGLVYDRLSRKLVYQVPNACGCSGTTTYLFDPQTNLWTQAPQHSSSLGVYIAGAGLAYDSARGRVLAFGGNNFITSAATNQLWAYSVAQNVWTRLADAPVAAMAPAFAYDSKHDRFLALVGNNTYLYDPNANSWSQYPATLLRPAVLQTWQAATYDTAYDVFVFQGGTPDAPIFSLFRYDPAVAPPVTIDTHAPSISFVSPTHGSSVSGVVTVSVNATDTVIPGTTDAVGVVAVQYSLDGAKLGAPVSDPSGGYDLIWNTPAFTNGTHFLQATVFDSVGNTASATVSVVVSNGIPAPVISNVNAGSISASSAIISWTTTTASDSQVDYGLTAAYGITGGDGGALTTAHSVLLVGLTPATTYHFRVKSRDAQNALTVSDDFTFTTSAASGSQFLLHIQGDASEASGTANGAVVTPVVRPAGWTGTLVVNGAGSVQFAPAFSGNGVFFQNCCNNTGNAYYRFAGANVGSVFNVNQGHVSFYLKSRYSFAQRPAGARFAFDVRDNDPNNHLFYFQTLKTSGQLLLTYSVGGGAQFYYVPAGTEEAKFGSGVTMKVTLTWNGSQSQLFLNDVLVQTASYVKPVPNWTAASNFNLGAYEYAASGGYNSLDDIIDEFTVSGPASGADTNPPAVSMSAPAAGATVSGTGVTLSANATDNIAMGSVQFRLDGTNLGSVVTGAGPAYSTTWNTTTAANGAHTLTAIATDAAGNTATAVAINVTVNNPLIPPVISSVTANPVSPTSATITWTTDKPSDSRVSYGLTPAYGSQSPLDTALVTSHSVAVSGLTPATTYHYQVTSRDAQGTTAVSAGFTFLTPPAPSGSGILLIRGDATELSGTANGSLVTPYLAPSGFTGTLVAKGTGSVNHTPAQTGNGVYFQACCGNTNNAYYKFTGAAVGSVFNVNQGQ
ncbi:MAG: Ig-like domain-containing protein, partial [Bryobacteraceae bacterium]|nr:Ig-like domain-containing protein [Bryobacteraceae bacterium]